MKKLIILVLLCLGISSYGQVFNTGETLKRGSFSIGINPVYMNDNLALFLRGGAGITSGLDLALNFGFFEGDEYVGGDLEWKLLSGKPDISLVTGAHVQGDFGLDCGLNISVDIKGGIDFFSGLDTDIMFYDNDTQLLLWIPVGVEIGLKRSIGFILEGDIPVTDPAYGVFGGGVAFYF